MKYFISIALSPEQYCIGIVLTEWVTKWSKEYFISIALQYCISSFACDFQY